MRDPPALQWDRGFGLVERYGPQLLPLRGRGYERADIRIHAIDPLSRDFWPFPPAASIPRTPARRLFPAMSQTLERQRRHRGRRYQGAHQGAGLAAVSRLAELPLRRGGADAKFGLDLSADFARIAGKEQPGSYLVGLRAPDQGARHWLRVTITDLSLSAIEEPGASASR